MKLFAPAKINLMLHVIGRRDDGYHVMQSVMGFADVGDILEAVPADTYSLTIDGPFAAHAPLDDTNLVTRAVQAMEAQAERRAEMALTLIKYLPASAGLGGGSADAAAAMHLLNAAWSHPFDEAALQQIGLQIGAELPICIVSKDGWVEGVGDRVTPQHIDVMHGVLIWPGQGLATAEIFGAYKNADTVFSNPITQPEGVTIDWLANTRNDLMPHSIAALPAVADALEALADCDDCLLARMTGTGACVFGLFSDRDVANKTAAMLAAAYPAWWVKAFSL